MQNPYPIIAKKPQKKQINVILNPLKEHSQYNHAMFQTTLFFHEHTHRFSSMSKIVLSFRFRSIEFQKKRSLLFFIALELLTSQKAMASLSSKNLQSWKIRKGRLVACKVTLRNINLFEFLDTFLLTLPRREKLYPFSLTRAQLIDINTNAKDNNIYVDTEGNNSTIKKQQKSIKGNTGSRSFRLGELVLFYPLEVGVGLHPDLSNVYRNCTFSSITKEERLFHLYSFAFPVR